MKASELVDRLQRSYIKPGDDMPGGMFMTEVTLGRRRADALYVGFFASRGKTLVGFEVKVARSDWLAELDQPAKAETWHQYCHQWYVVAPNDQIVRPEELPDGWGLMIPDPNPRTKTRMKVVVRAAKHEREELPWHVVHALVQKADSTRMREVQRARDEIRSGMWDEIEKRVKERVARESGAERLADAVQAQQALIDGMTEILGVQVVSGEWAHGDRITLDELRTSFATWLLHDRNAQRALRYRLDSLTIVHESVGKALEELRSTGLSAP